MPDQKALKFFDQVASEWETMRTRMYGEGLRDKILQAVRFENGQRVLDVGCGSGFLTIELLRRGAKVTAADASTHMLAEVTKRASGSPFLETFHVRDDRLGPSERFDAVVANMFLHHVEDPAAMVLEMVRVLRPGGRLALGDLAAHPHASLEEDHHDRWMGFEASDLVSWFRAAGLVDVDVRPAEETCSSTTCAGEGIKIEVLLASARRPG